MDLARLWCALLNIDRVLKSVDGSMAELGVDKGNFSSILAWFAGRYGRTLYMLDTFSGFAPSQMDAEVTEVQRAMFRDASLEIAKKYVGESEGFRWIVGEFPASTTEELNSDRFSFVSLDCDLYEPIRDGLDFFWGRLQPGGMIFVHDYSSHWWPGATRAVDEFLARVPASAVLLPDKSGTIVLQKSPLTPAPLP